MLLSKTNLVVGDIAAGEETGDVLSGVHVAGDGTTVASNGRMMLAVEPVPEGSFFPVEEHQAVKLPKEGVTIPINLVEQVRKNLPKEKKAVMQQAAITKCDRDGMELTTISKTEQRQVAGRTIPQRYPRWREVFAEARGRADVTRLCVDRKDLIKMLTALQRACPDPSNKNAVFIEFGGEQDPMVLRTLNLATGQHAVGIVNPLDTNGMWISANEWEEELYASEARQDGEEDRDLAAVPVKRKKIGGRRVGKKKLGK